MAEVVPYVVTRENAYLTTLTARLVRADVWLRMVASGQILIDPVVGAAVVEGTPSYMRPVAREGEGVLVRGECE